MKIIRNIAVACLSVFLLSACAGQTDDTVSSVFLEADKNIIDADGIDKAVFTVYSGNADVTSDAMIVCNNDGSEVSGASFTTQTPGMYSFTASYGDISSEPVSIEARASESEVPAVTSRFVREVCIMYFTYQTCSFCPSGYRYLDKVIELMYPDVAHVLSLHASQGGDIMSIPEADGIATDMLVQGYPSATVDMRQTLSLTNDQSSLIPAIDASLSDYPSHCGIAISSQYDETAGNAKVDIDLYSELASTYRLAVYVVENGIVANQLEGQISRPDYVHHYVARQVVSSSYKGDNLGIVEQDKQVRKTYEVTVDSGWNLDNTCIYALAIDADGYVNNMAVCPIRNGVAPFNYISE